MVWPVIGAIATGLLNNASNRRTNAANLKSVTNTNAANALEAHRNRQFQAEQAEIARNWDRQQIIDAEERALAYNDPAAVRARFEAAGINPRLAAYGNGFGPASNTAPSPVAQGGTAHHVAHTAQPMDFSFVGNAFAAYQNGKIAEAEQQLRRTQIEMENTRLTRLMERATMRPIVPGIYGDRPNGSSNQGNGGPNNPWRDFDLGFEYPDRDTVIEENKDLPATVNMTTPTGGTYTILNNEVFEEGPMAWANGIYAAGAMAFDAVRSQARRFSPARDVTGARPRGTRLTPRPAPWLNADKPHYFSRARTRNGVQVFN